MMKEMKTCVLIFLLLILAIHVHAWPIPDTGQTLCYDEGGILSACPSSGQPYYGQDASYTIDPPSYAKLDANGAVLSDDAATWAVVKDNVTGLMWENKTSDGSVRDGAKTFTWCDTNPETNGGNQGSCGTGEGNGATDTAAFIRALNDANFGGFSDWRMPAVKELESILDMGRELPAVNPNGFLHTASSDYWSSTTFAGYDGGAAWCVPFGMDNVSPSSKTLAFPVRAVRGGPPRGLDHFVMNGDGTVTDSATGLMWQQGTSAAKMHWREALEYAEGLTLADYDDWRLPTLKELGSIVDYSSFRPSIDPAIDMALFPETVLDSSYFSSTTGAPYRSSAWCVDFLRGYRYWLSKDLSHPVRAVRGGQPRVSGHLVLSEPRRAASWEIGEQKSITWDPAEIAGNVKISLSRQGGNSGTFTEVLTGDVPNSGSYNWTVTGPASVNCVLKIEPLSDAALGTTQGLFNIKPPLLANAGSNQVVFDKATLDGSSSQGDIISWNWTLAHHTNAAYSRTATGQKPDLDHLMAGFYDVRLTISDGTTTSSATRLLAVAGPWDVTGDGKIGLPEVIYILQKAAGMR
jgi:hypothetical protein